MSGILLLLNSTPRQSLSGKVEHHTTIKRLLCALTFTNRSCAASVGYDPSIHPTCCCGPQPVSCGGCGMESPRSTPNSSLAPRLATALQLIRYHALLTPNELALSCRFVCRDAAVVLGEPPCCTASLSQPLPPHAAPWAVEAGQQHVRQLPFRHKLQLLCTAAASGSEANLEVALALLQPSVFPELLHGTRSNSTYSFPGVAAVEAGHPQLLGWLVRHCPALLADRATLRAAAKYCDLAGLQAVWAALGCYEHSRDFYQALLAAAAASSFEAVTKVEWVLAEGRGRTTGESSLLESKTAAAAARSGDLGRLRWLRERGCPMDLSTLESALQHADLSVAQWLVGEAGVELPAAGGEAWRWKSLIASAARSPDGVPKLQWLTGRGAPQLGKDLIRSLLCSAAQAGQVDVVRYLLSLIEAPTARQQLLTDPELSHSAVASGSTYMVEFLRQAGCTPQCSAFEWAARAAVGKDSLAGGGNAAMVMWLARTARVSADGFNLVTLLEHWPNDNPAHTRDLLQAVQLLVGEAGCAVWDADAALQTAARRGDLALVQYLLQQTPVYQPGWEVLVAAAEGGCEALLEWLVEQHPGCLEGAGARVSPYVIAAANGDLGTLTTLQQLGVPWGAGDVVAQAVQEGPGLPALRWLEEHGAPVGSNKEEAAAVEWVMDNWVEDAEEEEWLRGLLEPNVDFWPEWWSGDG